jgi:peptide/nickel transport system substrate-binding protein
MHLFRCESNVWTALIAISVLLMAGCAKTIIGPSPTGSPREKATATQIMPTPQPPPPKTLIICLGQEPDSLYLYGATTRETDTVLQALYDGPFDLLDYQYQPVILERIPSLENGDAQLNPITVVEDDIYINPDSQLPENLIRGKPYLPSGCESPGCIETYKGGEVLMDQLEVVFKILPGITWSDGEPLTASDSVFSFMLDSNKDTPTTKYLSDRTAEYQALDDLAVKWKGIPGFLDPDYGSNFWSPLPMHQLADYSPADLLTAEESSQSPLGWGPYILDTWEAGSQILLKKNENYFRSDEGLPNFDVLIFRFPGGSMTSRVEQLLTGECDIIDESAIGYEQLGALVDLEQQGKIILDWTPGALVERIDFNLDPAPDAGVISLFGDVRTRQAIAGCINRQRLVDELLFGLGTVPVSYLPEEYPFHSDMPDTIHYNVAAAEQLLDEVGWVYGDDEDESLRESRGVRGLRSGVQFEFNYLSLDVDLQADVAEYLEEDLAQCGIKLVSKAVVPEEILAPWPEGEVFGRRFEVVGWSWPIYASPPCEMFASGEIPNASKRYGINASGFSDSTYDDACRRIQMGLPDRAAYRQGIAATEEILAAQLPAIPLFQRPRLAAHAPGICGLEIDPTAFSVLWNIEVLNGGEDCTLLEE